MAKYDICYFEALGAELEHLQEETDKAIEKGLLPKGWKSLITPDNLQQYMAKHPELELPDLISTKTHSKLPEEYLHTGVKKSVITRSAGYDHFEHLADVANITSLRLYCVNAVAQTAVKFVYAACGLLNHYTVAAQTFERSKVDSFMELNENRIATVFGVGKIGKRAYELLQGCGLTVQGVDIREKTLSKLYGDSVKFVSKEEALATSDIIVNLMNLTRDPESVYYNVGYFNEETLRKTKPGLIFVNVTRGEIAPEAGLMKLYKEGHIAGIGVDVFGNEAEFSAALHGEPAINEDVKAGLEMLKIARERTGNIYVQPHQGFNSDVAASTKAHEALNHVIEWVKNGGKCFDEQLPYYGKTLDE